MPRVLLCTGCNQTHVIRDEMVGRQVQCDCGCVQTVPSTAPYTFPPATGVDSWLIVGSSAALLLLSLLVGGSVAAWVVMDHGAADNTPVAAAPVTTAKEKPPPEPKPKEMERERTKDKERERPAEKDAERPRPPEPPVLRTPNNAGPRTLTKKELRKRLLQSVVLIYHTDGKWRYTGSGSVIHRGRKLIITNQHVVQKKLENAQGKTVGFEVVPRVEVLFPQAGEGSDIITDKKYYESMMDRHQGKPARVLGSSADPDLAVIQLEEDMPQDKIALPFAPQYAGGGEDVVLVGNSGLSSGAFGIASGTVKNRLREIAPGGEVWKSTWTLETHITSYHGDSGSAVVNYQGHIVGVHFGAYQEKGASVQYAADRDEVLTFLKKFDVKPEEVVASDVLPPASAVVLDILKQLDDPDLERCRKGVEDLSRVEPLEARRAIPALVRALQRHPDPEFRRRVTEELERIGPPAKEDIGCLEPAMRIPYKPLKLYVLHAIAQLGLDAKQAIPALVLGLKDTDGEVRQKAALGVKGLGSKARALAFAPVLKLANDSDEEVARAGLDALLELGALTEAEIDILTEALGDVKRRLWVRRFAAHRLGLQGEKAVKAVPALVNVLGTDKDINLLSFSIGALQRIGDKRKEAGAALVSLIVSHPLEKIRLEALEAVESLDPTAFPTAQMLECSVTDKSPRMRELIAKHLGLRLGALKPEQMTEFIPLFRHKEPVIVQAGLQIVLMKKRDAGPLAPELAVLVKHADAKVRRMAFDALQATGPAGKGAVPLLLETLKEDEAQRLPVAVTIGLIECKDAKVVETVLPHLLAGLHPRTRKPGAPLVSQINTVLVSIGQPAVEEIFSVLGNISYRGTDNINHRENLFLALAKLGPSCRSKQNYERLTLLRAKESRQGYKSVLEAVGKALKAMDPD